MNYGHADTKLHHRGHGGSMQSRKLENNTYLKRLGDDEIGLLLHNTYVARFRRDGSVILDSGGWRTKTTKDRLRYVSGVTVISHRPRGYAHSLWWIAAEGWDTPDKELIPFFDGIHLDQGTGEVLSPADRIEEEREAIRPALTKGKLVKNYLSFLLDPDSMATFAADWKVTAQEALINDTIQYLTDRPHVAARHLLECRYFDMGVAMKAIELDIAVRGELERSAHWEAMEWAQLMGEGKEPKHFRSTMRRLIDFSLAGA